MSETPRGRESAIQDELVELWIKVLEAQADPDECHRRKVALYSRAEELIDGEPDVVEEAVTEARLHARRVLPFRAEMDVML